MVLVTSEGFIWEDHELDVKYGSSIAASLRMKSSQISPSVSSAFRLYLLHEHQEWAKNKYLAEVKDQNRYLEELTETTLLFRQNKINDDDYGVGVITSKKEIPHEEWTDFWDKENTIDYEVNVDFSSKKNHKLTVRIAKYLEDLRQVF